MRGCGFLPGGRQRGRSGVHAGSAVEWPLVLDVEKVGRIVTFDSAAANICHKGIAILQADLPIFALSYPRARTILNLVKLSTSKPVQVRRSAAPPSRR